VTPAWRIVPEREPARWQAQAQKQKMKGPTNFGTHTAFFQAALLG